MSAEGRDNKCLSSLCSEPRVVGDRLPSYFISSLVFFSHRSLHFRFPVLLIAYQYLIRKRIHVLINYTEQFLKLKHLKWYVYSWLSLSVSVCLPLCLSLSFRLSLSLHLPHSTSVCLPPSLSVSVCLSSSFPLAITCTHSVVDSILLEILYIVCGKVGGRIDHFIIVCYIWFFSAILYCWRVNQCI